MAYVPDEAIKRTNEIGMKAFLLFSYYCMRADKNGCSFAQSSTIASELEIGLSHIYEYRKKLIQVGWISADGDNITVLLGFPLCPNSKNRSDGPKIGSRRLQKSDKSTPKIGVNADINADIDVQKSESLNPEIGVDNSKNRSDSSPKIGPACKEEPNQLTNPFNQTNEPTHAEQSPAGDDDSWFDTETVLTIQEDNPESEPDKPKPKRERKPDALFPLVEEIFSYWKLVMNHPRASLSTKRRRMVRARLKEKYTVDDIKRGIDGCKATPFNMGENKDHAIHDDLELICRTTEHLDRYIGNYYKSQTGQSPQTQNVYKLSQKGGSIGGYNPNNRPTGNRSEPIQENLIKPKRELLPSKSASG